MYSDTCVILAAGKGTRMGGDIPKCMIEVAGQPILKHVIDFWRNEGCNQFIFVLGYKYETIRNYLCQIDPENWTYVIQMEQKGIADAIMQVKQIVPDRFIVALGDCLNVGKFQYPGDMIQGYGIWQNDYKDAQMRGCNVVVVKDEIKSVYEKPPMDYAGIGTYFFDRRVFGYIHASRPFVDGEVQISDVMTTMVRDGQVIKAVPFVGQYINCTYQRDIEAAKRLFK